KAWRGGVCLAAALACWAPSAFAEIAIPMTYLRQEVELPPVLSNLDPIPEDRGVAGAEVALTDTKTTGSFMRHDYSLAVVSVEPGGDSLDAARKALAHSKIIFIDGSPKEILSIADLPEARDALLVNVSSGARGVRDADCRANVLHTMA